MQLYAAPVGHCGVMRSGAVHSFAGPDARRWFLFRLQRLIRFQRFRARPDIPHSAARAAPRRFRLWPARRGCGLQSGQHFRTTFNRGPRQPFAGSQRFSRRTFFRTFTPYYFGYYGYPYVEGYPYDWDYSYASPDSYPAYDYYSGQLLPRMTPSPSSRISIAWKKK